MGVAQHGGRSLICMLADRKVSNFCLETQHVVAAGPDQPQLFNFPKRSFEARKL